MACFRQARHKPCFRQARHKPCFRQAHCFMQGPLRFFPVPKTPTCARSHVWGFPAFTDEMTLQPGKKTLEMKLSENSSNCCNPDCPGQTPNRASGPK